MFLAIYDISGIQKFIFSSSKLKEQVGGSKIIHDVLYKVLPLVLGEKEKEWEDTKELFDFSEKQYNIVYIGGGNAMVLFENKKFMMEKTREMQKEVLKMTSGELTLCFAFLNLDSEPCKGKKYNELYSMLMKELAKVKSLPNGIRLANGFAITEYDSISLEPLTVMDEKYYGVANHMKKREVFKRMDKEIEYPFSFADEFESFREKGKKSFVAVVHIDGDSMGKSIMNAMENIGKEKDVLQSMLEMRELSREIDSLYKDTLKRTLLDFYVTKAKEKIAFREIISDGDDITFIISAGDAFDFTENFMQNLASLQEEKTKLKEHGFQLSASAGIVFIHDKYPFDEAYEMAEQLCKSAKAWKKTATEGERLHISSMDFHIISSGAKLSLEEFRKRNYEKREAKLHLRPYYYDGGGERDSYNSFKQWRRKFKNKDGVARSKLKGLRNAYGEGAVFAERYFTFLVSRETDDTFCQENAPFCEVFVGDSAEKRAVFFDALDSMDF